MDNLTESVSKQAKALNQIGNRSKVGPWVESDRSSFSSDTTYNRAMQAGAKSVLDLYEKILDDDLITSTLRCLALNLPCRA